MPACRRAPVCTFCHASLAPVEGDEETLAHNTLAALIDCPSRPNKHSVQRSLTTNGPSPATERCREPEQPADGTVNWHVTIQRPAHDVEVASGERPPRRFRGCLRSRGRETATEHSRRFHGHNDSVGAIQEIGLCPRETSRGYALVRFPTKRHRVLSEADHVMAH